MWCSAGICFWSKSFSYVYIINDPPNSSDFCNFSLLADDSNLFHTFETGQTDIDMHEVRKELYKVQKWCYANKVTINLSKSIT